MKLAFVYDAVYPWETGGIQKRVWELSHRLAEDHDVHWYGLHYWDGPKVVTRRGVTLHGVADPRDLYVGERRSISEALYFSLHLLSPLSRAEFDVIDCQVFPYFSCYSSKLSTILDNSRLVFTWHEVWREFWYDYLGYLGIFGRIIERGAARLPDEHIAVSERTRRNLSTLGGAESTILPNGIELEEIASTEPADEAIDVLFVGRFIWEKNPLLLVNAIKNLRQSQPDVQCYMVGDGPERESVSKAIADGDLGSNVTLLEFRESHEEIIAMMKAANVFVLPSQREGFGITVLEALACGTPVVTIDHPDNAATELVEDGITGFIVDPTAPQIADGIQIASTEIDSSSCVDAAADYDWDEIAEAAEGLYREISQ